MKPAKSAYPAYLILALGILVLTWSTVLGSSLPAKLADLGGLHKANKITATWLSNSNQPEEGSFSLKDMRQLTKYNLRDYCYIANLPKRPNVEIGDYTYYSDNHDSPENFTTTFSIIMSFLGIN